MGFKTPYVPVGTATACYQTPLKEMKISKRACRTWRSSAPRRRPSPKNLSQSRRRIKRSGCGRLERPYKTMTRQYEARVLRAFRLLFKEGCIYRGLKPIYWCIHDETALAEAEIEYKDKTSPSVYGRVSDFGARGSLKGAAIVIWTTTPGLCPQQGRGAPSRPGLCPRRGRARPASSRVPSRGR